MTTQQLQRPVGELLRQWRELRRLSQLEFSIQADISTRHLSFVETGRSNPSRDMVLHLAEELQVPLRERNHLLLAAGFAPVYSETALDSPQLTAVRAAVRQVLTGHQPYPAVVVDRGWNLIDANAGAGLFTEGLPLDLLAPPMNVLRESEPRRHGAPDHQPRRVAVPPARPVAPPGRAHRRPRRLRSADGAGGVSV
jgi:transcriptional regulator with XRE-family HTH domain